MQNLKVLLIILIISSCKNEVKPPEESSSIQKEEMTTNVYPSAITKVFNAHGGINVWNKMKTLRFSLERKNGKEVTTTDLKTRAELIDTPTYTLGFDGKNLWVNEKNDNEYKGNPKFYKGLYMYFYAMPFIVSDRGIIYEKAEPLRIEDKTFPGILISYESGIGESPDDQYIIYYDEQTGQMQWLGYTVTFFEKGKKSTDFHYIKYDQWQTINGLMVPKSIDWYNTAQNKPTTKKSTIEFLEVKLFEKALDKSFFMPANSEVRIIQ